MHPHLFLDDLRRKPAALRALATHLRDSDPWEFLRGDRPERVVLLGMGSSAYASGVAAARLRARGLVAVAELASSDLLPAWGPTTLCVAVSASGASRETIDALGRLPAGPTLVVLTEKPDSAMTGLVDHTVLLHAGEERGGVACRSFQHTLALLLALDATLTGSSLARVAEVVDQAAAASEHLLRTSDSWLPDVAALLAGPDGTYLAAPARRLSSAQQGALMLREGPRRPAVGCEAGDWAHVEVYLTKNTDYRLLVFAGSAWDDGILEWTRPRGTTIVAVGGDFPGSAATVHYPYDDVDDVRLLTETLVPELVASHLWLDQEPSPARPDL